MQTILKIKDLIEETDDLDILDEGYRTRQLLNTIGRGAINTSKFVAKNSFIALKKFVSLSKKGLIGVKSWIDYLESIERYKHLIDQTEKRLNSNINPDREKFLRQRLVKYNIKLKRIQLREQEKRTDFIADTEDKIKELNNLKSIKTKSESINNNISELELEINNRKQFLSKIGY